MMIFSTVTTAALVILLMNGSVKAFEQSVLTRKQSTLFMSPGQQQRLSYDTTSTIHNVNPISRSKQQRMQRKWSLYAGGFEWDDPTETMFDQSGENPFKNPDLLSKTSDDSGTAMKIDPARLLSPRLNGANLYFIGMMGTGKSSIASIVAKRKY
jgi:hypothetical protein